MLSMRLNRHLSTSVPSLESLNQILSNYPPLHPVKWRYNVPCDLNANSILQYRVRAAYTDRIVD